MHRNNTNNYIERRFRILKDLVFARTQVYNCIQVFQFITINMKRFYMFQLLSFAHRHLGHFQLAKHFLCSRWNTINMNFIQKSNVKNEFFVLSAQNDNNFYIINSKIGTVLVQLAYSVHLANIKVQFLSKFTYHCSIFFYLWFLMIIWFMPILHLVSNPH